MKVTFENIEAIARATGLRKRGDELVRGSTFPERLQPWDNDADAIAALEAWHGQHDTLRSYHFDRWSRVRVVRLCHGHRIEIMGEGDTLPAAVCAALIEFGNEAG